MWTVMRELCGAFVCLLIVAASTRQETFADGPRATGPQESMGGRTPVPLGLELESHAPSSAVVRLGRLLFHDARLSADGTVACATCHIAAHAFSQPTRVATGIRGQQGTRKAPALVNLGTAIYPHFFRDGRVASLEAQVLQPVLNPVEMGNTEDGMLKTLRGITGYRPYFVAAFGSPEITTTRVEKAIVGYERTRLSGNSPWDRWRRNHDESAVSEQVKRGHELFFGKAGCNQCHFGSSFTDSSFHNLGVSWDQKTRAFADLGRYAVTKQPFDTGAFKTPTLREVTKHPPYMHDGSVATLRDVILLYNRGGEKNPFLDSRMRPLNLSDAEVDVLVAFLHSLEGEGYMDEPPASFPR
jgi:cytochrome c peroxidase